MNAAGAAQSAAQTLNATRVKTSTWANGRIVGGIGVQCNGIRLAQGLFHGNSCVHVYDMCKLAQVYVHTRARTWQCIVFTPPGFIIIMASQ